MGGGWGKHTREPDCLPGLLALPSWLGDTAAAPGPPCCSAQGRHATRPPRTGQTGKQARVAGWDLVHKDCVLGGGAGRGRFVRVYQCNFSFCSHPQQNSNTCGRGMCIASLAVLHFRSFRVVLWPQSLGYSPPLPSSALSHPSPVCPPHPESPDCHSTESPLEGTSLEGALPSPQPFLQGGTQPTEGNVA